MAYLKAGDIISGQEGTITLTKSDNTIVTLGYVKNIEATFEKEKSEIRVLGRRGAQNKTVGWTGSGSMTLYYITSLFREMALKYAEDGVDTNFTLTITNSDPSSSVGTQTVVLRNCNLDSVALAKLDVDSTELDEDVDFTFDDFDIQNSFTAPTYQA